MIHLENKIEQIWIDMVKIHVMSEFGYVLQCLSVFGMELFTLFTKSFI